MTTHTLTPAQSAMIWDALTVRIADPVMVEERDDARALRDLLTSGRITLTPYES